jgi:hypothetical protein
MSGKDEQFGELPACLGEQLAALGNADASRHP